jgi:hypothetical protein
MTEHSTRYVSPVLVGLLLVVALGGCARATDEAVTGENDVSISSQPPPEWVSKIFPEPGANTTATRALEVRHDANGPQEGVRLLLDGVDVTTYSEEGRGLLVYDPDAEAAPVELEPGRHSATLQLVRLPEAGEQHEVIDTYEWEFTVS